MADGFTWSLPPEIKAKTLFFLLQDEIADENERRQYIDLLLLLYEATRQISPLAAINGMINYDHYVPLLSEAKKGALVQGKGTQMVPRVVHYMPLHAPNTVQFVMGASRDTTAGRKALQGDTVELAAVQYGDSDGSLVTIPVTLDTSLLPLLHRKGAFPPRSRPLVVPTAYVSPPMAIPRGNVSVAAATVSRLHAMHSKKDVIARAQANLQLHQTAHSSAAATKRSQIISWIDATAWKQAVAAVAGETQMENVTLLAAQSGSTLRDATPKAVKLAADRFLAEKGKLRRQYERSACPHFSLSSDIRRLLRRYSGHYDATKRAIHCNLCGLTLVCSHQERLLRVTVLHGAKREEALSAILREFGEYLGPDSPLTCRYCNRQLGSDLLETDFVLFDDFGRPSGVVPTEIPVEYQLQRIFDVISKVIRLDKPLPLNQMQYDATRLAATIIERDILPRKTIEPAEAKVLRNATMVAAVIARYIYEKTRNSETARTDLGTIRKSRSAAIPPEMSSFAIQGITVDHFVDLAVNYTVPKHLPEMATEFAKAGIILENYIVTFFRHFLRHLADPAEAFHESFFGFKRVPSGRGAKEGTKDGEIGHFGPKVRPFVSWRGVWVDGPGASDTPKSIPRTRTAWLPIVVDENVIKGPGTGVVLRATVKPKASFATHCENGREHRFNVTVYTEGKERTVVTDMQDKYIKGNKKALIEDGIKIDTTLSFLGTAKGTADRYCVLCGMYKTESDSRNKAATAEMLNALADRIMSHSRRELVVAIGRLDCADDLEHRYDPLTGKCVICDQEMAKASGKTVEECKRELSALSAKLVEKAAVRKVAVDDTVVKQKKGLTAVGSNEYARVAAKFLLGIKGRPEHRAFTAAFGEAPLRLNSGNEGAIEWSVRLRALYNGLRASLLALQRGAATHSDDLKPLAGYRGPVPMLPKLDGGLSMEDMPWSLGTVILSVLTGKAPELAVGLLRPAADRYLQTMGLSERVIAYADARLTAERLEKFYLRGKLTMQEKIELGMFRMSKDAEDALLDRMLREGRQKAVSTPQKAVSTPQKAA